MDRRGALRLNSCTVHPFTCCPTSARPRSIRTRTTTPGEGPTEGQAAHKGQKKEGIASLYLFSSCSRCSRSVPDLFPSLWPAVSPGCFIGESGPLGALFPPFPSRFAQIPDPTRFPPGSTPRKMARRRFTTTALPGQPHRIATPTRRAPGHSARHRQRCPDAAAQQPI